MAVYKIPQDVEADDKFVGPLSFKQFIFVGIAAIAVYLSFLSVSKGFWPAMLFFVPIVIVFGFLGFPWGRDQPTEIWLAARIRFLIKPRVRIWNQSGVKELVTITAPKKIEKHYTDGLSQNEVTSRLNGLATLLDSRGWAIKNVSTNVYNSPLTTGQQNSDRLLDMTSLPQEVSDVTAGADILDENTNATAQHFEEMIKNSEQKHRQEAIEKLNAARVGQQPIQTAAAQPQADFMYVQQNAQQQTPFAAPNSQQPTTQQQANDFWFLNSQQSSSPQQQAQQQPGLATFQNTNVVSPQAPYVLQPPTTAAPIQQPTALDEQALLERIHQKQAAEQQVLPHHGMRTIQPLSYQQQQRQQEQPQTSNQLPDQPVQQPTASPAEPPQPQPQQNTNNTAVTPPVKPAIINLANNDDLNVATLARQAKKAEQQSSDGEVVISLR